MTPHEAAGAYPLTATFAGDATHTGASATSTFTVTHEETTLTYTGPTKAADGQPITLSGVLKEDGDHADRRPHGHVHHRQRRVGAVVLRHHERRGFGVVHDRVGEPAGFVDLDPGQGGVRR